jgi:hypothetical protein
MKASVQRRASALFGLNSESQIKTLLAKDPDIANAPGSEVAFSGRPTPKPSSVPLT